MEKFFHLKSDRVCGKFRAKLDDSTSFPTFPTFPIFIPIFCLCNYLFSRVFPFSHFFFAKCHYKKKNSFSPYI